MLLFSSKKIFFYSVLEFRCKLGELYFINALKTFHTILFHSQAKDIQRFLQVLQIFGNILSKKSNIKYLFRTGPIKG